jgi:hypothetical protein
LKGGREVNALFWVEWWWWRQYKPAIRDFGGVNRNGIIWDFCLDIIGKEGVDAVADLWADFVFPVLLAINLSVFWGEKGRPDKA